VDDRISSILIAFETSDGTYRRDAVDAALNLRPQITPHLIHLLEQVLADPAAYARRENYLAHLYAIELLGHFREPRAHDVIVNLASLPPELPHDLFGDLVTEDLPAILISTCGGSVERIKELLLNRQADEYCRSSACRALVYAAVEGIVPRQEIVALLGSLFTGDEAEPDSDFWGFVANSACDLYPKELMATLNKAIDDGLISTWMIGPESFEQALKRGQDWALRQVKDNLRRYTPDDFHDRMSWWACFRQETQPTRPPVPPAKAQSDPKRGKKPMPRPPKRKKKRP